MKQIQDGKNMRKRDPKHECRLRELIKLSPEDCKQQINVTDYRHDGYVASEVLASLIRVRFGAKTGVLAAATEELHRRVISGVEARTRSDVGWRKLARDSSEVIADTSQYFWNMFLRNKEEVCNAEVRFQVYLSDRVTDYKKHLLTEKNSMKSIDDMTTLDEDGNRANFIDSVRDDNGKSPEEEAIFFEDSKKSINIMAALSTLPQSERYAYYFRIQCEYGWKTVADLLGCSIPTARKYLKESLFLLQGEL